MTSSRSPQELLALLAEFSHDSLRPPAQFRAPWFFGPFNPRRRKDRTPSETADFFRRILLDNLISRISDSFALERCSILLPHAAKTGVWNIVAHRGFPTELLMSRFYQLGIGLTGRVLNGEQTDSDDILRDPRHSGRHGANWILGDGSRGDALVSRAFFGVPLSCLRTDLDPTTHGALICIREGHGFTECEQHAIRAIAGVISARLEILDRWAERSDADMRHLQLRQLWHRRLTERERYTELLRLLQKDIPFKRMLLAMTTDDGQRIVGKSALGFRCGLLDETNRVIRDLNETQSGTEDILASVVRSRSSLPSIVSPSDPRVHEVTAFRHEVTNPLFLIPIPDVGDEIQGVVLAELPDHLRHHSENSPALSIAEQERFRVYAQMAGVLISSYRAREHADTHRLLWKQVLHDAWPETPNDKLTATTGRLEDVLHRVSRHLGIGYSAIYEHRSPESLLFGVAGYGVNSTHFRTTTIPILARTTRLDLPLKAFCTETEQLGPLCSAIPLCEKSLAAEIDRTLPSVALPVTSEGRVIGVLVASLGVDADRRRRIREVLTEFLSLLGSLLHRLRLERKLADYRRRDEAHESLVHGVTSLTTTATPTISLRKFVDVHRVPFQAMLQDIGQLFASSLVSLFVPERPVLLTDSGEIPPVSQNVEFIEIAGYRVPEVICKISEITPSRKIYSANRSGLTSSVLRTMKPQISDNIPEDPLWSKTVIEFEENTPRTWMGVPLVVRRDGVHKCYGVLSVTRIRYRSDDGLVFHNVDVQSLQNIATFFAGLLSNRDAMHEAQIQFVDAVSRFDHDLPNVLIDIHNALSNLCDGEYGKLSGRARQHVSQVMDEVNALNGCLRSLIEIYTEKHASAGLRDTNADVERVIRSVRSLLNVQPEVGGNDVSFESDIQGTALQAREAYIVYILYLLIHNSCRACNKQYKGHKIRGQVHVRFSGNANGVEISIRDDGTGFLPSDTIPNDVSSDRPGRGIGSLIADILIHRLDGTIQRKNIKPHGAEVKLVFSGNVLQN